MAQPETSATPVFPTFTPDPDSFTSQLSTGSSTVFNGGPFPTFGSFSTSQLSSTSLSSNLMSSSASMATSSSVGADTSTSFTSSPSVPTHTTVVSVAPGPIISSASPSKLSVDAGAGHGFFDNTAAIAGVFTVVGLIALALIIGLITNSMRRRRSKRSEKEITLAAAAPQTVYLDDPSGHSGSPSLRFPSDAGTGGQTREKPISGRRAPSYAASSVSSAGAAGIGVATAINQRGWGTIQPYAALAAPPRTSPMSQIKEEWQDTEQGQARAAYTSVPLVASPRLADPRSPRLRQPATQMTSPAHIHSKHSPNPNSEPGYFGFVEPDGRYPVPQKYPQPQHQNVPTPYNHNQQPRPFGYSNTPSTTQGSSSHQAQPAGSKASLNGQRPRTRSNSSAAAPSRPRTPHSHSQPTRPPPPPHIFRTGSKAWSTDTSYTSTTVSSSAAPYQSPPPVHSAIYAKAQTHRRYVSPVTSSESMTGDTHDAYDGYVEEEQDEQGGPRMLKVVNT